MTIGNRATLKILFETGDVPTGQDYADLIDSFVNLAETGRQSMAGPLATSELIAARVSANTAFYSGVVSAASVVADSVTGQLVAGASAQFSDTVTGNRLNGNAVTVVSARVSSDFHANSATIAADISAGGTIYASAMRSVNGFIGSTGIVSAAGSAQATATPLQYTVNRLQGVVDGVTTGFALPANRVGLVQHIYNETAASANLWPPIGGTINGLSANAPYGIAANTAYTVIHLTASAYAVK